MISLQLKGIKQGEWLGIDHRGGIELQLFLKGGMIANRERCQPLLALSRLAGYDLCWSTKCSDISRMRSSQNGVSAKILSVE